MFRNTESKQFCYLFVNRHQQHRGFELGKIFLIFPQTAVRGLVLVICQPERWHFNPLCLNFDNLTPAKEIEHIILGEQIVLNPMSQLNALRVIGRNQQPAVFLGADKEQPAILKRIIIAVANNGLLRDFFVIFLRIDI